MKKKLLSLLIVFLGMAGLSNAQQDKAPSVNKSFSTKANLSLARQPNSSLNTMDTLFDLEFDYPLTRGGFAGITWLHSKFWVSKWASDSLFEVDPATGALSAPFFITGVTGVRGMTFDGKNVWVSNNTAEIFKIDTLTHAVLKTVTCPLTGGQVRGISYDSTVAGGGFWISNFNTEIMLVDTIGTVQNAVLASQHGLGGMYGIAFDPYSTGGPYIWAFDQGTNKDQHLCRINIATGITDVVHDVNTDIPSTDTALAGGVSITNFGHPGPHTIIGVSQDSPTDRIFGLELADFQLPAFDAAVVALNFTPATTMTPEFLVSPINWVMDATNAGGTTLDSIKCVLKVNDGTTDVFAATGVEVGIPSLAPTQVFIPGTFTPIATVGNTYDVMAVINTGAQTDLVNTNDSIVYTFGISDSTLSRHGDEAGNIGISGGPPNGGPGGSIGIMYDITTTTWANSLTMKLNAPFVGDSVYAEIWSWNPSTGKPDLLLDRSLTYIIQQGDANGVTLTLPYSTAPMELLPGSYIAAIHEHRHNVTIAYSQFNWRPNTTWIKRDTVASPTLAWDPSENFTLGGLPLKIVPFLDLNVQDHGVSVNEIGGELLSVYPNPNSTHFVVDIPVNGEYKLTVTDIQGKVVYQEMLQGQKKETIQTSEWSNGIYVIKAETEGKNYIGKMTVSH